MSDDLVKLTWEKRDETYTTANTSFGSYSVDKSAYDGWQWSYCFEEYYNEGGASCDDMADGMARAEAHWRERVEPITAPLADRIAALEAENAGLKAALNAFDPNVIGSGPSTDMWKLHGAQMAARITLAKLEKGATK